MPITNPLSGLQSPTEKTKGEVQDKKQQAAGEAESIPRTVAGVVNDKGDIVDKEGKVIGNVKSVDDHEQLIGSAVTEKGDVISELGENLANVHIDENYVPTQIDEASTETGGGGWNVLGKAKSAMQYGDSVKNAVSYGKNLQGAYNKYAEGQKGEEGAETKAAGDVADDATKKAEGAKDSVSEDTETATPVKLEDRDDSSKAKEDISTESLTTPSAGDVTDTAKGAAKQGEGLAKDTKEGAEEQVNGATEEVQDKAKDTEDGVEEQAGSATGEAKDKAEDLEMQSPKPISEGDDKGLPSTEDVTAGVEKAQDTLGSVSEAAGSTSQLGTSKVSELGSQVGEAAEGTLDLSILKDTKVDEDGNLVNEEGEVLGNLVEGKAESLVGLVADEEGQIKDESGNVIGKAEPIAKKALDFTVLKGTKVNKAGNLVNDNGDILGRLIEGDAKQLIGKRCDEEGNIWNDSGKIVGKAEPLSDSDREHVSKDFAPFENFPDAIVEADGRVMSEGRQVGEVVEGDPKRMKGSRVDEDGDILDRRGNVIGKAKPWDEPEEIPEEAIDMSSLAGKRVNKAGNVVDAHGQIFGRVVEGNVKALVGRMCDKEGNILSEGGEKIGKAELVSESEREGSKEGPFAELSGCTVSKDGKVVTPSGEVVGRLTSGDGKTLYGRAVDEDGDVLDKNGNVIGKAERWEEPEVEKKKDPLAGRRVNREGNVVDEDGNLIGKLVSGDLNICSGKEIDDDGDVVNAKGNTIGHVSLIEDIPPEPEEPAEAKEAREQAEKDKKLAGQLAASIEQSLDKIRPILKMITDKVDRAERTPKEELDEEALVREVKPLIEEGGKILTETNGVVRGMDPDGRIQRQAKHKAGTKEATPEEHHLAEMIKELTGNVTETIDNAKRKIEGMPHAKKELNPLWGLLSEPLFQIIAAVGLLLNGVLGLVGKLLSGLGLGGLVDNLLGTLGLNKVLDSLGLGSVTGALTGKQGKDKK